MVPRSKSCCDGLHDGRQARHQLPPQRSIAPSRAAARTAGMFMWFIALAFPFFGVINDLMGAFAGAIHSQCMPVDHASCWLM